MDPLAYKYFHQYNQVRARLSYIEELLYLYFNLDVTKLFHFARSPTWIVPPGIDNMRQSTAGDLVSTLDMNGNRFTDAQIKRFKDDPEFYKRFVKSTEEVVNSKFNIVSISSILRTQTNIDLR